jgi:hypothetical protein
MLWVDRGRKPGNAERFKGDFGFARSQKVRHGGPYTRPELKTMTTETKGVIKARHTGTWPHDG